MVCSTVVGCKLVEGCTLVVNTTLVLTAGVETLLEEFVTIFLLDTRYGDVLKVEDFGHGVDACTEELLALLITGAEEAEDDATGADEGAELAAGACSCPSGICDTVPAASTVAKQRCRATKTRKTIGVRRCIVATLVP